MRTNLDILNKAPIHVYQTSLPIDEQLYQPFAWGDAFLREVNTQSDQIILHIWPMTDTLILGMMDRRLPHCEQAIKLARTHGYRAVVRNVGGLAVVADEGILNFSFIIPKTITDKLSIPDAYQLMVNFIQEVFSDETDAITHQYVAHSYCPGDYDLTISGKKFAGIAQRRFKDGVAVSIYLSVSGNQQKRGELVRAFYQAGLAKEATTFQFPDVQPDTMATLSDLLGVKLSVADVCQRLLDTLARLGARCNEVEPSDNLKQAYQQFYDKMIERNRKIK